MRPRTGMFETATVKGQIVYRGRLLLADGSRTPRFDLTSNRGPKFARDELSALQADEDRTGVLLHKRQEIARAEAIAHARALPLVAGTFETASNWHERYLKSREHEINITSSRGRWRKWIHPHLGDKPMAAITREDVEVVRDAIDTAVDRFVRHGTRGRGRGGDAGIDGLMPKAASNVWSVLTTACRVACSAKRATGLRVREDNPCANVEPPTGGRSRRKGWIYPIEFLALVSCAQVPLEYRELYTIACYTYLRPGELYELRWQDISFDANTISITRAWDWKKRDVKPPKTLNGIRSVPIHPHLLPMLERMRSGTQLDERVVPIMDRAGENKAAQILHQHLKLAGVNHPRLSLSSSTHMPVGFRSWRETGITWLAVSGVDVVKIQRRAGHDDVQTTLGYVKEAEGSTFAGEPFPALPSALILPGFSHVIGDLEGLPLLAGAEGGSRKRDTTPTHEHSGTSATGSAEMSGDAGGKPGDLGGGLGANSQVSPSSETADGGDIEPPEPPVEIPFDSPDTPANTADGTPGRTVRGRASAPSAFALECALYDTFLGEDE